MSWFNDLTEEDRKKIVADEVFLLGKEPVGTEHFHEDPKSPEHKTSNIEEQTSVESKEPGEIGEDGNEVIRFLKDKLKFRQLVLESTHEKGSILDQVWINAPLIGRVQVEKTCLRFSDHDMVKIVLRNENA